MPEPRPDDASYYEHRTDHFRQGDIFRDVPLAYPLPPDAATYAEGNRRFIAGPFDEGFAMLLTPTCTMAAQGEPGKYAHPVRALAPIRPIDEMVGGGYIKPGAVEGLERFDQLINYLYLPPIEDHGMPASVALLYMPVTLHHDLIADSRIAQLSKGAAIHLKRQLAAHVSGELFGHADFSD